MMRKYLLGEYNWGDVEKNTNRWLAIVTANRLKSCFDVVDGVVTNPSKMCETTKIGYVSERSVDRPNLILIPGNDNTCIVLLRRVSSQIKFDVFVLGANLSLDQAMQNFICKIAILHGAEATQDVIFHPQGYCMEESVFSVINDVIDLYYSEEGLIKKNFMELIQDTAAARSMTKLYQELLSVDRLLEFYETLNQLNPVTDTLTAQALWSHTAFQFILDESRQIWDFYQEKSITAFQDVDAVAVRSECDTLRWDLQGLLLDNDGLYELLHSALRALLPGLHEPANRWTALWAHLLQNMSSLWHQRAASGFCPQPLTYFRVASPVCADPHFLLVICQALLEQVDTMVPLKEFVLNAVDFFTASKTALEEAQVFSAELKEKMLYCLHLKFHALTPANSSTYVSRRLFKCPGIKDSIELFCDFMAMLYANIASVATDAVASEIDSFKKSLDDYLQIYTARLVLVFQTQSSCPDESEVRSRAYDVFKEMLVHLRPDICDMIGGGDVGLLLGKLTTILNSQVQQGASAFFRAQVFLSQQHKVTFEPKPCMFSPINEKLRADSAQQGDPAFHTDRRRSFSF